MMMADAMTTVSAGTWAWAWAGDLRGNGPISRRSTTIQIIAAVIPTPIVEALAGDIPPIAMILYLHHAADRHGPESQGRHCGTGPGRPPGGRRGGRRERQPTQGRQRDQFTRGCQRDQSTRGLRQGPQTQDHGHLPLGGPHFPMNHRVPRNLRSGSK